MGEHEDDLESTVHEVAEEEIEAFPDTGDELDDLDEETGDNSGDLGEEPGLDEDPAEL